ncbi:SDR family NAD(P)-dependent oxidoreductase [Gilvimarinus sp. F26214L]|uniref:SDR family NAD(P)-dependent oxidoreductase n=1 Tax=Gilvimarinus sp. DZF01 TaxID=3461371 RepID=UPI004045F4EB
MDYGNLLEGKNIIITGGSSGIGFALAKKCVELGASVIITGRDQSKLDQAVTAVGSQHLIAVNWDVSNMALIDSKLSLCRSHLGGEIDVLVNNAGVLETTGFIEVAEEQWDRVYATNSKGLFFLTQAVCRQWIQKGKGYKQRKVINISSQGGFVGATYPYRMSKWDVAGLTQGLGLKLIGDGIIVNGIAPGIVATAMQPASEKQKNNIYCRHNPVKRYALPEEIAELAVFLISDASNFIIGQTIVCDGGFSIG